MAHRHLIIIKRIIEQKRQMVRESHFFFVQQEIYGGKKVETVRNESFVDNNNKNKSNE